MLLLIRYQWVELTKRIVAGIYKNCVLVYNKRVKTVISEMR